MEKAKKPSLRIHKKFLAKIDKLGFDATKITEMSTEELAGHVEDGRVELIGKKGNLIVHINREWEVIGLGYYTHPEAEYYELEDL